MRFLIDLQSLQLANGTKPHVAYAWMLAREVARGLRDRQHSVLLLLDGRLTEEVERARSLFAEVVDATDIRAWFPPPIDRIQSAAGTLAAQRLYETYIARLKVDVVFMADLPLASAPSTFASIGRFARRKTAVLVHDVSLPRQPRAEACTVSRADLCITTSDWARERIVGDTGLPAQQCIVVPPAVVEDFGLAAPSLSNGHDLLAICGVTRAVVLCQLLSADAAEAELVIEAFSLLAPDLRWTHQLVIAHHEPHEIIAPAIAEIMRRHGLGPEEVIPIAVATPFQRVELYRRCKLVIALSSERDAFNFYALEAMTVGAPMIAVDQSSLPELIDRQAEALIDAASPAEFSSKLAAVLANAALCMKLANEGRLRAGEYQLAGAASSSVMELERLGKTAGGASLSPPPIDGRLRLAYISPLPPERSGIADYSAELLPELARYYDIELITSLERVDPALEAQFPVRDYGYFRRNADAYDRVLYHIGNSEFHRHMFDLLDLAPGTVVLHDFFLGDIMAHREFHEGTPNAWTRQLYDSHGYGAVSQRFHAAAPADVVGRFPCNFNVIRQAQGVIVHSPHSALLAQQWFGDDIARCFAQLPLLRSPRTSDPLTRRQDARRELGLGEEEFLVCSFGLLGPTKQNLHLLRAWLESELGLASDCRLVFVGHCHDSAYAAQLQELIDQQPGRIVITGWCSASEFRRYLDAADLAVQLRACSRGETSAAVLDAMNHGISTIVNRHGTMALLPEDAVAMIDDEFTDKELACTLEMLRGDPRRREQLGAAARAYIATHHAPSVCAEQYAQTIERFAADARESRSALIKSIRRSDPLPAEARDESAVLASAISEALPAPQPAKQLFLDISAIVHNDLHTGIQRVIKSLLRVLIDSPPPGFRVEAVYAPWDQLGYRYARRFALRFLGCPNDALEDAPITFQEGDHFVGIDLLHQAIPFQAPYLERMRQAGVGVHFVVYDLLPVLLPHHFPEGSAAAHARWLQTIAKFDSALCISNAVASELSEWLDQNAPSRKQQGFRIRSFHLGADLSAAGSKGLSPDSVATLQSIAAHTSFLMVGTVEPRKGHIEALDAFERLWQAGHHVNLVIVGKQGWMMEQLAGRLRNHPERGARLFWLETASDEYLEKIYAVSSCLLAASEGEGFGLPLIEGAQHGLPLLARDIPVFREVAGEHAFYFEGNAAALAASLIQWLSLMERGRAPRSDGLSYLTWQQSAREFIAALLDDPSARSTATALESTPESERLDSHAPV